MRGWRLPLALSAAVLLGQLVRRPALLDVAAGTAPADATLRLPLLHALLAPVTIPADWLNGGSRLDLASLLGWGACLGLVTVSWRWRRSAVRGRWMLGATALGVPAGLVAFVAFVVWAPRPVPRLEVADTTALVFDMHTHTALSHDGRRGFGAAANARWHERAGFHAAFVTDHNSWGAARAWQVDRAATALRLLDGEELSLAGLHLIVLGMRISTGSWERGSAGSRSGRRRPRRWKCHGTIERAR